MYKQFKYNNKISSFNVENDKVLTTITLGNYKVTNPTLDQFLSTGWEEYTYPNVEPEQYIPTLEELVESKIREKYSINQEFEVNRKKETEPEAFQTYYNYVEECIAWAHEQDYKEKEV